MRRLGWLIPAVTLAAVLVAGCGSGSSGSTPPGATAAAGPPPTAATLASRVNTALANATSVHISAHVLQENSLVALNMSMTHSGEMSGEISLNKAPVAILVTQGQTYIKLTAAALKAMGLPSGACSMMCGKYLKMPAGDAKSMLNGMGWTDLLGHNTSPNWKYVRTVTVNGQPAWQMSIPGRGSAYIAAQGQPYPLRLTEGSNRADFTQWNSATVPPPPPANEVVDLSQVMHF